jgi:tetratricopeptide (TPR) repeat protein
LNRITPILFFCLIASGSAMFYFKHMQEQGLDAPQTAAQSIASQKTLPFTQATTLSGAYLAGRYAQRHFDWSAAGSFMGQVLNEDANDPALLKRAMVLAMGAGDAEKAIALAQKTEAVEGQPSALAELFIAVGDFKNKNYESAAAHIQKMPAGGLSDFILPLLNSWGDAALGKSHTDTLDQNTIHLYHAILINDFLGQPNNTEKLLLKALNTPDLGFEDVARIADLYAHIGNTAQAKKLYQEALALSPEHPELIDKIAKVERGDKDDVFVHIKAAEEGVGEALYDMARLLAQEYSDESAQIFAQMAIYLNPDSTKVRFLLASLAARNERYDDAIEAYRSIAPEDVNYKEARRTAANLLDEIGRKDEALTELENLAKDYKDVDAMIQVADIYRVNEKFPEAIKAYNKAEDMLGKDIGADYWQLFYARGMAYEQAGQWNKAEKDLTTALGYQPSHPYILNYLGYAWADQGIHLDKALDMIQRAVTLRPDDGYITDSLGWVYFKMHEYKEAVPYLEQAVELMPYDTTVNDHLGDAYWNVGRHREARFQWERAKNHSKDEQEVIALEKKITEGLPEALNKTPKEETNPKITAQSVPQ